jgi:hypothetical protein
MKKVYVMAMAIVMAAGVTSAANLISDDVYGPSNDNMSIAKGVDCTGDQDKDQDKDQEQRQDGSCADSVAANGTGDQDGAPDQIQDRKQDQTC